MKKVLSLLVVINIGITNLLEAQICGGSNTTIVESLDGHEENETDLVAYNLLLDGTVDSFEAISNKKKYLKTPKSDTFGFFIRKKDAYYKYKIERDGLLYKNWTTIDYRNKYNGYFLLFKDYSFSHEYVISIQNGEGKIVLKMDFYKSYLRIWGIYPSKQKKEISTLLKNKKPISFENINKFPAMKWVVSEKHSKDFLWEKYNTTEFNKIKLTLPQYLTVKPNTSILFLMGSIPDSINYEYQLINSETKINNKWQPTPKGENLIELRNLPLGNYELQFKLNNDQQKISYNIFVEN
ncbi:MAG: hypothetical protein KF744_13005 [Taibaiella sp.]|nr:hypothetical protein [Taibaiella sp.]